MSRLQNRWRDASRFLLAALYLAAGYLHIKSPAGFLAITPGWVPFPQTVIFLTGVAEIAGALGLLFPQTRGAAAIGLALYALCVFPANINHALNNIAIDGSTLGWSYHGPRLLLQPVIIWWALWAGRVIDWPFGRRCARHNGVR
ncbi:MAG: DoxX family protein [Parasphingorhabdus sp.]|nr:DoxX family protein [Parasphingorhabdus sp.]